MNEQNPYREIQKMKLEPSKNPFQLSARVKSGDIDLVRMEWKPTIPFISYEAIERLQGDLKRFYDYTLQKHPGYGEKLEKEVQIFATGSVYPVYGVLTDTNENGVYVKVGTRETDRFFFAWSQIDDIRFKQY